MAQDPGFTEPAFQARDFDWREGDGLLAALRTLPKRGRVLMGGLAPEQAEALASWVLAGVSQKLHETYPRHGKEWKHYADAKCTIANAIARDLLTEAPEGVVHNANMSSLGSVPHAIMLLKIPVQEGGKAPRQQYMLIDPTFAQFMTGDMIGERMKDTPERRAIAHDLMKQGYTPLDEDAAKAYVTAFMAETALERPLRECGGSYLELLCKADGLAGMGAFAFKPGTFASRVTNRGVTRG